MSLRTVVCLLTALLLASSAIAATLETTYTGVSGTYTASSVAISSAYVAVLAKDEVNPSDSNSIGKIVVFDAQMSTLLWTYYAINSDELARISINDDTLFAVSPSSNYGEGRLIALHLANGTVKWTIDADNDGNGNFGRSLATSNTAVAVGYSATTGVGRVYVYRPDNGELSWTISPGTADSMYAWSVAASDQYVLVGQPAYYS